MRPLLTLGYILALAIPANSIAGPDFAPNPKQAFAGFVAVNPPRSDVPVGALWINGYGPTGAGAATDNLETVKSLSNLSIDKNLQLDLTMGLLNLLSIDPKARDHYAAHFSDLSLVRVKDMSKLPGTKGEPRIVEALKAGSVTVSSDTDFGLNGQSTGFHVGKLNGSTANDRSHSYSIEAHDMYIAIHVATREVTHSKEQELRVSSDGKSSRIDDFLIAISAGQCGADQKSCEPAFGLTKLNSQTAPLTANVRADLTDTAKLTLPIPISDGHDGLFDTLALHWVAPCTAKKADGCRRDPHLYGHYEGSRLQDLPSVSAKNW